MNEKDPKPEKKKISKTSIPYEYFNMTPIEAGERDPIPLDELRNFLVNQLSNLDEKGVQNTADIIIELIKELRELKSNQKDKS